MSLRCNDCGQPLFNIGGLGETELMCNNPECPSNHPEPCPKCGENKKSVLVQGIGDLVFTCKYCNNVWES